MSFRETRISFSETFAARLFNLCSSKNKGGCPHPSFVPQKGGGFVGDLGVNVRCLWFSVDRESDSTDAGGTQPYLLITRAESKEVVRPHPAQNDRVGHPVLFWFLNTRDNRKHTTQDETRD